MNSWTSVGIRNKFAIASTELVFSPTAVKDCATNTQLNKTRAYMGSMN